MGGSCGVGACLLVRYPLRGTFDSPLAEPALLSCAWLHDGRLVQGGGRTVIGLARGAPHLPSRAENLYGGVPGRQHLVAAEMAAGVPPWIPRERRGGWVDDEIHQFCLKLLLQGKG